MIWWLEKRNGMVGWFLYEPVRLSNGKLGWDLVMVDWFHRDLLCFKRCPITGKHEGVSVTNRGRVQ